MTTLERFGAWFRRLLMTMGALSLISTILTIGFLLSARSTTSMPDQVVVEIDLESPLVADEAQGPLSALLNRGGLSVRAFLAALERARDDERVLGIIARIGSGSHGVAVAQEIREAVLDFRKSGKPAVAFSESFGEVGPGTGAFYLASAFDEIWLQPSGMVGLTGLAAEVPFLKGTLDWIGVTPRVDSRGEFKNAMNTFTETKFTEAHRVGLGGVINDFYDQMLGGIAEGRSISLEETRALAARGPFLAIEAKDAKLIDHLGYRDEVATATKVRAGNPEAKLVSFGRYLQNLDPTEPEAEGAIALIYGVGQITRGSSQMSPTGGSESLGSDTAVAAFREAVRNEDVKAIVFRVDSPGGSYVASDSIWRETVRAQEAGKPVIVSMGNVAGSGGYFVAMNADAIVAMPGTITGSIGVLAGKAITRNAWTKIGVTWDRIVTADSANAWSPIVDYSPEGWERFQSTLDTIYLDFITKVSDGRGMDVDQVDGIARGRIWSGADAVELGLVDEIGGFRKAFRLAKKAIGVDPAHKIRLEILPRAPSLIETILGQDSPDEPEGLRMQIVRALDALAPLLSQIRSLRSGAQPLLMPVVPEVH